MNKLIIGFLITLPFILQSCDEIDDPIPKGLGNTASLGSIDYITDPTLNLEDTTNLKNYLANTVWDTINAPDNSTRRFMVLEEFTGHTCIFCPIGTREIERLDALYIEQLIPVGIHAGSFAVPRSSGTKYTTDFRAAGGHGETYLTQFNPGNAYPRGMVSRLGGTSVSSNSWDQDIKSIKDDVPLVVLKMSNYLDEPGSILRVNLEIKWLQTLPDSYNLQLYLTEDHIIDWQKDGSLEVENYDHRHVLRKVVNDTYGLALDPAELDSVQNIQYIFPFDVSWNKDNIEAIAFIFNSDPSSYEVIQANSAHIK